MMLIIHVPVKQTMLTGLPDNILKLEYHAGFEKIEQ